MAWPPGNEEANSMGWMAYFRGIRLREEMAKPLREMLALEEDDFVQQAAALFPDLPEEVLREGYDFLQASAADVAGDRLWPTEGVQSPRLDKLLLFLGKITQPGTLIAADLDGEIAGWMVQEDGSVKELEPGFRDPDTGAFWPLA
jgi:hypothetical protein